MSNFVVRRPKRSNGIGCVVVKIVVSEWTKPCASILLSLKLKLVPKEVHVLFGLSGASTLLVQSHVLVAVLLRMVSELEEETA